MQATARARFLRGSARKVRIVVDLIRGKSVDEALNILSVLPQAAAVPVRKTLHSAASNALAVEGTANLKSEDLRIQKICVDGGPIMKRIRPRAMGRAFRIAKRLCHLTIVVEGEHTPEPLSGASKKGSPARSAAQGASGKAGNAQKKTRKSAAHKRAAGPSTKSSKK